MKKFLTILSIFASTFAFSQGDCPGVCITGNGAYTAASGSVAELNATNRGCLTAGEASSSFWMQVCFTSSGTFQFYINPNGNRNDFDFAIWNGSSCAPTTAPIRCSWAAVAPGGPCATCDHTGLNGTATDITEGAFGDGWLKQLNVSAGQCITMNINNYGSGSNGFSIFFTGTAAMGCPAVLPIELTSFDASVQGESVVLRWTCATEINNQKFTVQRSTDAVEWDNIGTVNGAGNAFNTSYKYYDNNPEQGLSYYRLSQTDYDGTTRTHTIVSVDNTKKEKTVETVFSHAGETIGHALPTTPGLYIIKYTDGSYKKVRVID